MKTLTTYVSLVVCVVTALVSVSHAVDLGIITGGEKGTYYQFGLNLRELVKDSDITLNVYPSKGSVENIYAVYQRPGTQMGIVQADVLAFVGRLQTNPTLNRIANKTKMVFPLYNEEVHLLARRGISDFDDLTDKRVAIGKEGSGTYLTTRLLFKVSEIVPREMVPVGTTDALAELKAGRLDAMFFVAGHPVSLFRDGVTESDDLVLISIANKSIREFYPGVTIPAGTYGWQDQPVETVAVKAVLVSFNFRRTNCDNVGRFARTVATNMGWLRANGHPKWKSVDLNFRLKGWEQYDCVTRYLSVPTAVSPSEDLNPVLQAIKDILSE